jgi:hypothetical protein
MNDSEIKAAFLAGLQGVLNNWRVWLGDDELRAVHVGFDSYNTEIAISLLTDREPYLERQNIAPLGLRWPTADWRLTCVNKTWRHGFPDARELLEWMKSESSRIEMEEVEDLNARLKALFFSVATSSEIVSMVSKFRRVSKPVRVRVQGWFDNEALDAEL